jgi:hypothetical protein
VLKYWGARDTEALAGVRRRLAGFSASLRSLEARIERVNRRLSMREQVSSALRVAVLTKDQWIKSFKIDCAKLKADSASGIKSLKTNFARKWSARSGSNPRPSSTKANPLSN